MTSFLLNQSQSQNDEMRVTKRNGNLEIISFDKILKRVKVLGKDSNIQINYSALVMKVIDQLYDKISTSKIDELTAEQCTSLSGNHSDYDLLAGKIVISNHHKQTSSSFYETMYMLNENGIINDDFFETVYVNREELDNFIDYSRDYLIDYFGFKTLERAYLIKVNDKIVERPQHMWLRVAISIHKNNLQLVKETYDLMSMKYFTHATPTLFNAGTKNEQLSSCYLIAMEEDSVDGIYSTLSDCAKISKWSGGIGLHIHNIRANKSHIKGTNGTSSGIVPMLRVFNNTAKYIDQGGGKRNGSFAIYLENWHADIVDFLDLKKNHGDEERRARDLFYALWISDLFMTRVEKDLDWTLFCPNECPGLSDVYGKEFNKLYEHYESENKGRETIKARTLWYKILDSQMETGTPYLLYKDAVNEKNNQKNLGTIKSSNLCCEITLYSDKNETAVCNLASIALPTFVENGIFNYDKLHAVTKVITVNLNNIIDINYYPTKKTERSNKLHRPIGIGIQGLADTFCLLDLPFHSNQAKEVNKLIFETIYHASLEKSNEIAISRKQSMKLLKEIYEFNKEYYGINYNNFDSCDIFSNLPRRQGEYQIQSFKPIYAELNINNSEYLGSYSSFEDSPISKGIFQFDMWGVTPSDRFDWDKLRNSIINNGLRNSVLTAPMPTASTSQILGFNECFEPFTSNLYSRRTLAGEFIVTNKYLINDLSKLGLWNIDVKNKIILNQGSIQNIDNIPQHIKDKYKIVWEIPMKHLIDMSVERGAYICQSQSLNLWIEDPSYKSLTATHFYAWKRGLKTGIYYLRRKAKHQAQQFTIEPTKNCEMCTS
jgi:ribonucleotide reductase alpha subunit